MNSQVSRFQARDLITVGVFTLMYMACVAIFGQLGAIVPILQVLGPFYIPLICGIVFMLFLTRIKYFGMVSIMGILVGALVLATGQSYWVPLLAVVLAPAADLIMRIGQYKKWATNVFGYAVFSLMLIGTVVPLFFMRSAFLERISARHDSAWVQALVDLTPAWMFYAMIGELILGAICGAFLGRAVFKKHFERAGIA